MAYNGWTNYETWNVALWFDNEQGSYRMRQGWAEEAWEDAKPDVEEATRKLADMIENYVREENPIGSDASMYGDLLSAALSEVDWHEIAENWMEEVDKEIETEEEENEA